MAALEMTMSLETRQCRGITSDRLQSIDSPNVTESFTNRKKDLTTDACKLKGCWTVQKLMCMCMD
jgi:hypothetical protein